MKTTTIETWPPTIENVKFYGSSSIDSFDTNNLNSPNNLALAAFLLPMSRTCPTSMRYIGWQTFSEMNSFFLRVQFSFFLGASYKTNPKRSMSHFLQRGASWPKVLLGHLVLSRPCELSIDWKKSFFVPCFFSN